MNFLRLPDALLSVLHEDEDIIAIDKPYGFNTHTNDSKAEHGEAAQDGLIEIYEKQLGKKLHIIHRLDQTTTGVLVFGKTLQAAKKYKDFFYNREVKKTYLFITKNQVYQKQFVLEQPIVHKGKELEAKTELDFIRSDSGYSLWQALPYTGRNHQIRIHAKAAGIPILGDSKYDGAPNSFLCLHNKQIQFPSGLLLKSKPPIYFKSLEWLNDSLLAGCFFEIDRRQRLYKQAENSNQCFRMVHNKSGSINPGYTLDQYGLFLVLNWHRPMWTENEEIKFTALAQVFNKTIIVHLHGVLGNGKQSLVLPITATRPDVWTAQEEQTRYEIRAGTSSTGLHINQRLQRQWTKKNACGRSVLNLFSYTGAHGLAAALGGASQITMVDNSKTALEWAKRNFAMNSLDLERVKFYFRDSVSFIEQCQNKLSKYDLIICDIPTFFRREKGVFRVERDLEKLLSALLSCLKDNGRLLISTQFDGFFIDDLRRLILKVQKSLELPTAEVSLILPSLDFELADQKTNLKSFLLQRVAGR